MSGNAFRDTSPISLEELENIWSTLKNDLSLVGLCDIAPIGSTWKKAIMGDIDLAASYESELSTLMTALKAVFGETNVRRSGGRLVSVRYPIVQTGRSVQVDVMVGNPKYLSWSRFGPATLSGVAHYSPVKGVVRNLFLNTWLRETSSHYCDLKRSRMTLDFDVGLLFVEQTKSGVDGNVLKDWKTIESRFITDDPDRIVRTIFGRGSAETSLTIEECIGLTSEFGPRRAEIKHIFLQGLEQIAKNNPRTLGVGLVDPITYVRDVCKW